MSYNLTLILYRNFFFYDKLVYMLIYIVWINLDRSWTSTLLIFGYGNYPTTVMDKIGDSTYRNLLELDLNSDSELLEWIQILHNPLLPLHTLQLV